MKPTSSKAKNTAANPIYSIRLDPISSKTRAKKQLHLDNNQTKQPIAKTRAKTSKIKIPPINTMKTSTNTYEQPNTLQESSRDSNKTQKQQRAMEGQNRPEHDTAKNSIKPSR